MKHLPPVLAHVLAPVLAPVLALALFPAPAAAQSQTVDTAAGPVEVAANPARVVALDPAAIDTLAALGVPLAGVPAFAPPAYLSEAMEGVDTVGTLFEPDFEALAVLAPDLIVAGGRSQRVTASLDQIAPAIDMTIWGEGILEQGRARLATYGRLFDREAEATALAAEIDARLAEARAAVAGQGNALILMTNGGTVSAYGDDSRFGWLHSALDLPEAFPDITAETHGEAVSFEFIAEVDPDWILLVDRGAAIGQAGEAAMATLDNPLVGGTTAAQRGQIVVLDSGALYLAAGGVQATLLLLTQMTDAFGG